ncbi:unnamed protein product, partial [Ixodes hexagonus]
MQQGNVASPTYNSRLVTMFVGVNIISALLVGVKVMVLLSMYAYRESLPGKKKVGEYEELSHGDQDQAYAKRQRAEEEPMVDVLKRAVPQPMQPAHEQPKGLAGRSPARQAMPMPQQLFIQRGQGQLKPMPRDQPRIVSRESPKGEILQMPRHPQPMQEPKIAPEEKPYIGARESPGAFVQEVQVQLPGQPRIVPSDQPRIVSRESPKGQVWEMPRQPQPMQAQPKLVTRGQPYIVSRESPGGQLGQVPKQLPKQLVQEQPIGAPRPQPYIQSAEPPRAPIHGTEIQLPGQQTQKQAKGGLDQPMIASRESSRGQVREIPIQQAKQQVDIPIKLAQEQAIRVPGQQPGVQPSESP